MNKPNLGSVAKVEWDGGSSRVGMLVILDFFHAGQSWQHSEEIEAMIEKNKKGKREQGKNKDTCAKLFYNTN